MAAPPLSVPVTLPAEVVERCVAALRVPAGWSALRADAVQREGRVTVELLLAGPLDQHPQLRFEIPLAVTLGSDEAAPDEARSDFARALDQCRRAAASPALTAWSEGLTDCVARLDAVGDVGRLLCRGLRDGVAAEPLWV